MVIFHYHQNILINSVTIKKPHQQAPLPEDLLIIYVVTQTIVKVGTANVLILKVVREPIGRNVLTRHPQIHPNTTFQGKNKK